MADVFISYSRRDTEFVRRLSDSISKRGKEVWLDTEGIADGEVFPEAIKRAIEQSDAFVFVITPASVSSSYCENEVEYAREMQKRVVPVLRDPVADTELPAEIRDRNWVPFTDDAQFDPSVERLVAALDTDLEAARAHTRWLVKALEWDAEGRDKSFLLRGSELNAAEAWLASSLEDADPAPTPSQREYLLASRTAAARRQRGLMGASLTVAVISIGLLIFALISRGQAVSERVSARSQALAAESQAQLQNDPEISLLLGMRAVREKATAQSMFALGAALDASPLQQGLPTIDNPGQCGQNSGLSAAYSPDGRQIAEGACNGMVRLIDASTGAVTRGEHVAAYVASVAYSPGGSLLAAATNTGVTLINPRTGAVRMRLNGEPQASSVAFSPDGRTLAADSSSGITVWRLPGGRPHRLTRDQTASGTMVFSHDGRLLIVGGEDASVHVYDAASGRLVHRIPAPFRWPSWPEVVALSPNGKQLAVGYPIYFEDATASAPNYSTRTWDKEFDVVTIPEVQISSLAFSPDGTRLAVGAEDGTAGVWSIPTRQDLAAYDGPTAAVTATAFTPDGRSVLTASKDGVARVWRALGVEQSFQTSPVSLPSRVALAGDTVEIAAFDRPIVDLIRPSGARRVLKLAGAQTAVLSPDGRFALGAGPQLTRAPMAVWNLRTGRIVRRLASAATVPTEQFSWDDSRLALLEGVSNNAPGTAVILTLATGKTVTLRHASSACADSPDSFAFSRNGRRVSAADFCGYADVWDTTTGRLLRQVDQGGEVSAVDLSPDGSRLLVSSWDSRATIWSVASGRRLVTLIGDARGLSGAAFSPNAKLVATTSLDHTVRVWNAHTGQILRVLTFSDNQSPLAFSSDGSQIVVVESEPTPGVPDIVRVFVTCPACQDPRALLKLAAAHATKQLTTLERTVVNGA